jgi:hypothetical protein
MCVNEGWTMTKMIETARQGRIVRGHGIHAAHVAGLIVALGLLGASLAACGAPDAADADATFFAQQTAVAGSRPSPAASPTASPPEQSASTPTVALTAPAATATFAATETPTTEADAPTATVAMADLPVRLSGSGTDVSATVTLGAGVLLAQLTHTGAGTFTVKLLDAAGAEVVELADGSGPWVGSRAVVLPETGEYVAEVTADGDWQIELDARDPATSIVSELPFEQTGAGSQAVYFVRVPPGEHTLAASHDGLAGFSVSVISSDGAFSDEVIASSGEVDTTEPFTVPEPPSDESDMFLLIDIRASGNWTIRIE